MNIVCITQHKVTPAASHLDTAASSGSIHVSMSTFIFYYNLSSSRFSAVTSDSTFREAQHKFTIWSLVSGVLLHLLPCQSDGEEVLLMDHQYLHEADEPLLGSEDASLISLCSTSHSQTVNPPHHPESAFIHLSEATRPKHFWSGTSRPPPPPFDLPAKSHACSSSCRSGGLVEDWCRAVTWEMNRPLSCQHLFFM